MLEYMIKNTRPSLFLEPVTNCCFITNMLLMLCVNAKVVILNLGCTLFGQGPSAHPLGSC